MHFNSILTFKTSAMTKCWFSFHKLALFLCYFDVKAEKTELILFLLGLLTSLSLKFHEDLSDFLDAEY